MSFRIVSRGWSKLISDAISQDTKTLQIVCPYITEVRALEPLLASKPGSIKVVTRFNLNDFASGASDINALRRLLDARGEVRGVRNLHAKLYLFGSSRAIITSANLTTSGLEKNHELGIVTDSSCDIKTCQDYFDKLWEFGQELGPNDLDRWSTTLKQHMEKVKGLPGADQLKDHGRKVDPVNLPGSEEFSIESQQSITLSQIDAILFKSDAGRTKNTGKFTVKFADGKDREISYSSHQNALEKFLRELSQNWQNGELLQKIMNDGYKMKNKPFLATKIADVYWGPAHQRQGICKPREMDGTGNTRWWVSQDTGSPTKLKFIKRTAEIAKVNLDFDSDSQYGF